MTPAAVVLPPLRSPLAAAHRRLGAEVAVEADAEIVRSYADPERERAVVEGSAGVADVTVRAKIDVRGDVGRAAATSGARVVARIAEDWAVLLGPPGPVVDDVAAMRAALGGSTLVTDATHLYAGFALAGPMLDEALARLTGWDPATLEPGGATAAPVADVRAILLRRGDVGGVLEMYPSMEFARYLWDEVVAVVERLGGAPVGWDALRAQGWG